MDTVQIMIGLVEAFLALVCRLANQISGISGVEIRMKKIVEGIKAGNSSTEFIEEYQRVRMRPFTLRTIFLSLNNILVLFIVFFLLMAKYWSLEGDVFNLLRDDVNKLKTEVNGIKTHIWNFEAMMGTNFNEALIALQKRY